MWDCVFLVVRFINYKLTSFYNRAHLFFLKKFYFEFVFEIYMDVEFEAVIIFFSTFKMLY